MHLSQGFGAGPNDKRAIPGDRGEEYSLSTVVEPDVCGIWSAGVRKGLQPGTGALFDGTLHAGRAPGARGRGTMGIDVHGLETRRSGSEAMTQTAETQEIKTGWGVAALEETR